MAVRSAEIPLVCIASRDFTPLLVRFTSSLSEDFAIEVHEVEPLVDQGYDSRLELWKQKVDLIVNSLKKHSDSEFVMVTDIDLQFFQPFQDIVANHMRELDMAFQQENDYRYVNVGIICARPTPSVIAFWEEAARRIERFHRTDQAVVNDMIFDLGSSGIDGLNGLRIGRLPREFFNWSSGRLPQDMICHHPNCTEKMYDKWRQLDFVCRIIGHQNPDLQDLDPVDVAGTWTLMDLNDAVPVKIDLDRNGKITCQEPYEFARWKTCPLGANLRFLGGAGRMLANFNRYYVDSIGNELLAGELATFKKPDAWKDPPVITLHRIRD